MDIEEDVDDAVEPRPVLYTFRRCPYAMRARMALVVSGIEFEIREVVLRDKPKEMVALSPKATVPVLDLGHTVIDESMDILKWCLAQHDPAGWMRFDDNPLAKMGALVEACDSDFKRHLDHYKYWVRYPERSQEEYRDQCLPFLESLNRQLESNTYLFADRMSYADSAIFPFIRQFAFVDPEWFGSTPWPGLQRWLSELLDSELFKSIMVKYPQWQPGDAATIFRP